MFIVIFLLICCSCLLPSLVIMHHGFMPQISKYITTTIATIFFKHDVKLLTFYLISDIFLSMLFEFWLVELFMSFKQWVYCSWDGVMSDLHLVYVQCFQFYFSKNGFWASWNLKPCSWVFLCLNDGEFVNLVNA